jgi:hypothetical protein
VLHLRIEPPCSFQMPEELEPKSNPPAPPKGGQRRRGRRGGRGRARGPRRLDPPAPAEQSGFVSAPVEVPVAGPESAVTESFGSPISRAAEEVTQVVESLKGALEQMEEVLELVELAERQKLGDEREIESLRRALRHLQSSRGNRHDPKA